MEARYLAAIPYSIRGAARDGTSETRIATVEQVAAIADRVPPRYRALVLVAAFGRLRWGELVGLRRNRLDLERGTVTVAEQLVEVSGAFSVGPPKSTARRRRSRFRPPSLMSWPNTWPTTPRGHLMPWCS